MSLKEQAEAKAREYQVADVCQVWNGGCPNVRQASMKMFEWTKEQFIEKACKWIEGICSVCVVQDMRTGTLLNKENLTYQFKVAMEE